MQLSIIIPYYNSKEYTDELLDCLDKQMTNDVEVIVVDDGSPKAYKSDYVLKGWLTIIRKKNGGCATARNRGLKAAKGEYIQFIDSDDLVPDYFIDELLKKIASGDYDVIDFSWRSLNFSGTQFNNLLHSDSDYLRNPSVCTRCFKRSYIGDNRFNELKDSTEDEDFSRKLGYLDRSIPLKHGTIPKYMYFYRTAVDNSKIKRFKAGLMRTKRVTYYYNVVTADRTDILEAIKEDDKRNEVILMTNRCDIPELRRYCQIMQPTTLWTHYQKGDPYRNLQIIQTPIESQIILYINSMNVIGGLATFVYQFALTLKSYYDITLLVNHIDERLRSRIASLIRVEKYNPNRQYRCDSLIMLRILDTKPANIVCGQSIQMCHACKTNNKWTIPQYHDHIVNVSEASKKSFGEEAKNAKVIHNVIVPSEEKALLLVSATRIPAADKGNNEKRMIQLASMLNNAKVPFIWLNFSDGQLMNAPKGFYNMGLHMDIQPYIAKADYLVQLSDSEAFSYSILEALTNNTAVIVTPFASVPEYGIEDGKNGYIVPFDMNFDVKKLLNIPQFEYQYDNDAIIKQWRDLLGKKKPKKKYKPLDVRKVRVCITYYDIELKRTVKQGEVLYMSLERVDTLMSKNLITLTEV